MNKRLLSGIILVSLACAVLENLEHAVVLAPIYESIRNLRRPVAETNVWIVCGAYASYATFFTVIFSRWYRGKGLMEGARYGLYVSLITSLPFAYLSYATEPIPHLLALSRTLLGILQNVTYGVILAMVFGKSSVSPVQQPILTGQSVEHHSL